MNQGSWNKLPVDIQNIFTGASGLAWSQNHGLMFDWTEAQSRDILIAYDQKVGNPAIYYLPDTERQRWISAVQPVTDAFVTQMEAKGLPAKASLADIKSWVTTYSNYLK
jgi:TRAP-type C4-dicarboxylate transport system substrate-binding protein